MAERLNTLAEIAFEDLIVNDQVQLIEEGDDLHIAGDDWTLVLEGEPLASALIALEDEDGSPAEVLRETISDAAFASMRELDERLDGEIVATLMESPDLLAQTLSEMLAT